MIDSPAFRRWFGKSKVVGKDKQPLVVYHGSKRPFHTFDYAYWGQTDPGFAGKGFYFMDAREWAEGYALVDAKSTDQPTVIEAYLRMENPLVVDQFHEVPGYPATGIPTKAQAEYMQRLVRARGYDGIIVQGRTGNPSEYVVFDPKQIKSATGNIGTFDPNDADIRHNPKTARRNALYDWAYHATQEASLPRVRRSGLVPRRPRVKGQPTGVYFAPTERHARSWGDIVLRFPWPSEYEDDVYGDTTFIDGEVIASSMFTPDAIPAEAIAVKVDGKWVPLKSTLRKNPLGIQLRKGHPSLRRTQGFVQEWNARDMDKVFEDIGARVDVSVGSHKDDDVVSLDTLEAFSFGKGAGTRALKELLALTDKYDLGVSLTAEPFNSSMTSSDLVRFYERFGFEHDHLLGGDLDDPEEGYYPMIRYPMPALKNPKTARRTDPHKSGIDWPETGYGKAVFGDTTIGWQVKGPQEVEIYSVRTMNKSRRKGAARAAMTSFLGEADRLGTTVTLLASPLDKSTSLPRLVEFYKSLGFVLTGRSGNAAGHPLMRREAVKNNPKTAQRTHPALWERIVAEVTASDKGGRPGQWSARKAQRAVALYRQLGGGYIGPKTSDNALAKWTRERWRTRSGLPSLVTGERYLPSKALAALSPQEYAATTRAKRAGMAAGEQFVPQPQRIAMKTARFRRNPSFSMDDFEFFGSEEPVAKDFRTIGREALEARTGVMVPVFDAQSILKEPEADIDSAGYFSAPYMKGVREVAWMVIAPRATSDAQALAIGKRVIKKMIAPTKLRSDQPLLVGKTLFVAYPGGVIALEQVAKRNGGRGR